HARTSNLHGELLSVHKIKARLNLVFQSAQRAREREALLGADTQRKQWTFCGKFLQESDNAIEAGASSSSRQRVKREVVPGDAIKLIVFAGILSVTGVLARRGVLPRTRRIVPGEPYRIRSR